MLEVNADMQLDIRSGDWHTLAADARIIRDVVFIQEQNISQQDEWDDQDDTSIHFVAYIDDQAVATARLLTDHSIGRVAVLKAYRGKGIGDALMKQIIAYAKVQQRPYLILSSQIHAIRFYAQLGFVCEGEEYLDCNIPHIDMRLKW